MYEDLDYIIATKIVYILPLLLYNGDEALEVCRKTYVYNIIAKYIGIDFIATESLTNTLELNLNIITFNYDNIIEKVLSHLEQENYSEERKKKLKLLQKSLIHMYGDIFEGIEFIRETETPEKYLELFRKADSIYFLGFGFDETNIKNLGISGLDINFWNNKKIFITNYDSDKTKIEYIVRNLFSEDFKLMKEKSKINILNRNFFICISEKNIDFAIEEDFLFN